MIGTFQVHGIYEMSYPLKTLISRMYTMEKVRHGVSKIQRVRLVDAFPKNGNERKQEKR